MEHGKMTEYASVSKLGDPSGREGEDLCNGCVISVKSIYLRNIMMIVLFQLEVCHLSCKTASNE